MPINYNPVCQQLGNPSKTGTLKNIIRSYTTCIIFSLSVILLALLYFSGLIVYLFEKDYLDFDYPLDIPDIRGLVERIDQFESKGQRYTVDSNLTKFTGLQEIIRAVDSIQSDGDASWRIEPLSDFEGLDFTLDVRPSCVHQWSGNQSETVTLFIIVKSAVNNFARRRAIRRSWYLNETIGIISFKTAFIVGRCDAKNPVPKSVLESSPTKSWTIKDCESAINLESQKYGDIIQSSGVDSYYNNTLKTFMTYRYINERCSPDFTLSLDDDYVLEAKNFVEHLENMASDYLPLTHNNYENSTEISDEFNYNLIASRMRATMKYTALKRLARQYLWAGYLRNHVHPLRSLFSKWYVSYKEYPYNKYPPFITGGAILMSSKTIRHLYYATYFTRPFKFDDVYMGIIAYRLGIHANHSDYFMCNIVDYMKTPPIRPNSTECLAVHEIEPQKLENLWLVRDRVAKNELVDYDLLLS